MDQQNSSFSNLLSPATILALEKHDDALASICQESSFRDTTESTAESSDSSDSSAITNSGPMSMAHTVSSYATSVCSVDRNSLRRLGYVGSGTYCMVETVDSMDPKHHCTKNDSSCSKRYAYKHIDPLRIKCPDDFKIATEELANEAEILSNLDHENIIKLRGVSSERFSKSYISGDGFFLVMDILSETLVDRLEYWKRSKKQCRRRRGVLKRTQNSVSKKILRRKKSGSNPNKNEERKDLHTRIHDTVLGIAKGMKYLHSRNIVLRDMKPANIGYENNHYDDEMHGVESTVKLFDFGMAKNVDECDPDEVAGSPRYMAPEAMVGKGYTLAVDVYSFGVILYELCSLKRPFAESYRKHGRKTSFTEAVAEDGLKPFADLERDVCCPMLRALIEACCDHDPAKRPSFAAILRHLHVILSAEDLDCDGRAGHESVSIEFVIPFE